MERQDPAGLTAPEGREFGVKVGLALLVLAGISLWRGHRVPVLVLGGMGTGLLASGILIPSRLAPVRRTWLAFGKLLARVTTPVFLGFVYYLVVTPVGLIMRALGRRPLSHDLDGDSFWKRREVEQRVSDMSRQF